MTTYAALSVPDTDGICIPPNHELVFRVHIDGDSDILYPITSIPDNNSLFVVPVNQLTVTPITVEACARPTRVMPPRAYLMLQHIKGLDIASELAFVKCSIGPSQDCRSFLLSTDEEDDASALRYFGDGPVLLSTDVSTLVISIHDPAGGSERTLVSVDLRKLPADQTLRMGLPLLTTSESVAAKPLCTASASRPGTGSTSNTKWYTTDIVLFATIFITAAERVDVPLLHFPVVIPAWTPPSRAQGPTLYDARGVEMTASQISSSSPPDEVWCGGLLLEALSTHLTGRAAISTAHLPASSSGSSGPSFGAEYPEWFLTNGHALDANVVVPIFVYPTVSDLTVSVPGASPSFWRLLLLTSVGTTASPALPWPSDTQHLQLNCSLPPARSGSSTTLADGVVHLVVPPNSLLLEKVTAAGSRAAPVRAVAILQTTEASTPPAMDYLWNCVSVGRFTVVDPLFAVVTGVSSHSAALLRCRSSSVQGVLRDLGQMDTSTDDRTGVLRMSTSFASITLASSEIHAVLAAPEISEAEESFNALRNRRSLEDATPPGRSIRQRRPSIPQYTSPHRAYTLRETNEQASEGMTLPSGSNGKDLAAAHTLSPPTHIVEITQKMEKDEDVGGWRPVVYPLSEAIIPDNSGALPATPRRDGSTRQHFNGFHIVPRILKFLHDIAIIKNVNEISLAASLVTEEGDDALSKAERPAVVPASLMAGFTIADPVAMPSSSGSVVLPDVFDRYEGIVARKLERQLHRGLSLQLESSPLLDTSVVLRVALLGRVVDAATVKDRWCVLGQLNMSLDVSSFSSVVDRPPRTEPLTVSGTFLHRDRIAGNWVPLCTTSLSIFPLYREEEILVSRPDSPEGQRCLVLKDVSLEGFRGLDNLSPCLSCAISASQLLCSSWSAPKILAFPPSFHVSPSGILPVCLGLRVAKASADVPTLCTAHAIENLPYLRGDYQIHVDILQVSHRSNVVNSSRVVSKYVVQDSSESTVTVLPLNCTSLLISAQEEEFIFRVTLNVSMKKIAARGSIALEHVFETRMSIPQFSPDVPYSTALSLRPQPTAAQLPNVHGIILHVSILLARSRDAVLPLALCEVPVVAGREATAIPRRRPLSLLSGPRGEHFVGSYLVSPPAQYIDRFHFPLTTIGLEVPRSVYCCLVGLSCDTGVVSAGGWRSLYPRIKGTGLPVALPEIMLGSDGMIQMGVTPLAVCVDSAQSVVFSLCTPPTSFSNVVITLYEGVLVVPDELLSDIPVVRAVRIVLTAPRSQGGSSTPQPVPFSSDAALLVLSNVEIPPSLLRRYANVSGGGVDLDLFQVDPTRHANFGVSHEEKPVPEVAPPAPPQQLTQPQDYPYPSILAVLEASRVRRQRLLEQRAQKDRSVAGRVRPELLKIGGTEATAPISSHALSLLTDADHTVPSGKTSIVISVAPIDALFREEDTDWFKGSAVCATLAVLSSSKLLPGSIVSAIRRSDPAVVLAASSAPVSTLDNSAQWTASDLLSGGAKVALGSGSTSTVIHLALILHVPRALMDPYQPAVCMGTATLELDLAAYSSTGSVTLHNVDLVKKVVPKDGSEAQWTRTGAVQVQVTRPHSVEVSDPLPSTTANSGFTDNAVPKTSQESKEKDTANEPMRVNGHWNVDVLRFAWQRMQTTYDSDPVAATLFGQFASRIQRRFRIFFAVRHLAALKASAKSSALRNASQTGDLKHIRSPSVASYKVPITKRNTVISTRNAPPNHPRISAFVVGSLQSLAGEYESYAYLAYQIRTCQRIARGYIARRRLRLQSLAARRLQMWWFRVQRKRRRQFAGYLDSISSVPRRSPRKKPVKKFVESFPRVDDNPAQKAASVLSMAGFQAAVEPALPHVSAPIYRYPFHVRARQHSPTKSKPPPPPQSKANTSVSAPSMTATAPQTSLPKASVGRMRMRMVQAPR